MYQGWVEIRRRRPWSGSAVPSTPFGVTHALSHEHTDTMHVGGQYRQCNSVCKPPIGVVGANPVDLRYNTPRSDDAFKRRFAAEVKAAVRLERTELSEYIDLDDEVVHESLDLVFEELAGKGARMLVVLDGFDYALAGAGLTWNLWDQLRSLASPDHRFGSQHLASEQIRHEDDVSAGRSPAIGGRFRPAPQGLPGNGDIRRHRGNGRPGGNLVDREPDDRSATRRR